MRISLKPLECSQRSTRLEVSENRCKRQRAVDFESLGSRPNELAGCRFNEPMALATGFPVRNVREFNPRLVVCDN